MPPAHSNVVIMDRRQQGDKKVMDDEHEKHFHIDRRISIGHIWIIAVGVVILIATVAVALYQIRAMHDAMTIHTEMMEKKIATERDMVNGKIMGVNEKILAIEVQHRLDIARMERVDTAQYQEMIRRLELLQTQQNEIYQTIHKDGNGK